MKFQPVYKLLIGLVLYALAIWGATLFDDYRVSVFTFMLLCTVAFGMALWACVRDKKVVAIVLAFLMAANCVQAPAQTAPAKTDPKPRAVAPILAGCAIIVVGAIIIWGVWKLCKKMPTPPPKGKNPPATNEPPQDYFIYQQFQTNGPALLMPDGFQITEWNDWDTAVMTFQSSTNGRDWRDEYTVTNWFNNEQYVSIMYSNSLPLQTNWAMMNWTNEVPIVIDFSRVMVKKEDAPLKLWRALQQ